MIRLTRLDGRQLYLNADLVATVESHRDTVVTLVDGTRYVVRETVDQIVSSVTTYRATVVALAGSIDPTAGEPAQDGGQLYVLRPSAEEG